MPQFDWDEANRAHIAKHNVTTDEAEQVVTNNPLYLTYDVVDDEERFGLAGETDAGRVLYIFTTQREDKIRVVTCFKPSRANLRLYYEDRRSLHE